MAGLPQVGEEFADYTIVRELGRGGMGVVFEATQAKLGHRRVALKVLGLQHAADPQYRKRFQREASSLASLNSPHVIHIYEYGEFDGCLYIATQLISDGDLRTWLDRHGPLDLETALRLVEQVTFAVADAHAVNVIHRDIKPSNVLLRRDGEESSSPTSATLGSSPSRMPTTRTPQTFSAPMAMSRQSDISGSRLHGPVTSTHSDVCCGAR